MVNDKLTSINTKLPSNLNVIDSITTRYGDLTSVGASASLLNDLNYIVGSQGIRTGSFGFANTPYIDVPSGAGTYGYVEFFKHADNYVTVKIYSELDFSIFLNRFVLGSGTWVLSTWDRLH